MTGDDEQGWTRVDFARWFVEHDDVDEAARMLEPGDELVLGQSDFLDLAAALDRRGLSATYEDRRVSVRAGQGAMATTTRRPPLRTPSAAPTTTATTKKAG